jgi:hypothetical protein
MDWAANCAVSGVPAIWCSHGPTDCPMFAIRFALVGGGPPGHDSWVVGDAPYVSLHFLGAEHYANK